MTLRCCRVFNHDALYVVSSLLESFKKGVLSCRDAIITCVVNTLTCLLAGCVTFSILGHIAQEQQTQVSEVVKSGPGLVFLTYPEVVLKLPGASLWAIIFFVMLLVRNCYSNDGIGCRRLYLFMCIAIKGFEHIIALGRKPFSPIHRHLTSLFLLRKIVKCS